VAKPLTPHELSSWCRWWAGWWNYQRKRTDLSIYPLTQQTTHVACILTPPQRQPCSRMNELHTHRYGLGETQTKQPLTAAAADGDQVQTECRDWSQTSAWWRTFPTPQTLSHEYSQSAWSLTDTSLCPTGCNRKKHNCMHFNEVLSTGWRDSLLTVYNTTECTCQMQVLSCNWIQAWLSFTV